MDVVILALDVGKPPSLRASKAARSAARVTDDAAAIATKRSESTSEVQSGTDVRAMRQRAGNAMSAMPHASPAADDGGGNERAPLDDGAKC